MGTAATGLYLLIQHSLEKLPTSQLKMSFWSWKRRRRTPWKCLSLSVFRLVLLLPWISFITHLLSSKNVFFSLFSQPIESDVPQQPLNNPQNDERYDVGRRLRGWLLRSPQKGPPETRVNVRDDWTVLGDRSRRGDQWRQQRRSRDHDDDGRTLLPWDRHQMSQSEPVDRIWQGEGGSYQHISWNASCDIKGYKGLWNPQLPTIIHTKIRRN